MMIDKKVREIVRYSISWARKRVCWRNVATIALLSHGTNDTDLAARQRDLVHAYFVFCRQKGSASYNVLARSLGRRLEQEVRGRSEADRFSSGSSCWSCSRIRPTLPASRGKARTGNSSSPIRTKSRVDGVSARASPTWITTSCRARWGNSMSRYRHDETWSYIHTFSSVQSFIR